MWKFTFPVCLLSFAVFVGSVNAQDQIAPPDYNLAYVLATASYCSFAVTELDKADRGQSRAQRCLKAASKSDPKLLGHLDVELNNVEAYYDPERPEDAYLLVRVHNGVILAFRGTLTPPVDPDNNLFKVAKEIAKNYNMKVHRNFLNFGRDWLNNLKFKGDALGRHWGFDEAWQRLLKHLEERDCTPPENCSKFRSFIKELDNSKDKKLYITGHSKGGALATLATLDIPKIEDFPNIIPVTYTFSAPKSLTADAAQRVRHQTRAIWRFERLDDIVPSLPPDSSFWPWTMLGLPAYAHVGALALFNSSPTPELPPHAGNGIYQPNDDMYRIPKFFKNSVFGVLDKMWAGDIGQAITNMINANSTTCTKFVDSHFAIFSNVQALADAGNGDTSNLFVKTLTDNQGKILWGYSAWCGLLKFVR